MIVDFSRRLFLVLFFIGIVISSQGKTTRATSNGDWDNSGTWNNGIPACGDSIFVDSGITVNVKAMINLDESSTPACSTAMYIEVSGTLAFQTGKKLYIPCNSYIFVTSGGAITSGGGGGNSNLIEICQTTVWSTADSTVVGPAPVGPGLPIILEFFKAKISGDVVDLNWATLSEINNDFFTIQRSHNLSSIEDVLQIDGGGSSKQRIEYTSTDISPLSGTSYYRLKQTDYNGATASSNWIAVDNSSSSGMSVKLINGLESDKINLQCIGMEGQSASIYLSDMSGRIVSTRSGLIDSESFLWTIDLNEIGGDGIFVIRFKSDQMEESFKFFKKR